MTTYVDAFEARAESLLDKPALTFLVGGNLDTSIQLTYGALLERVRGIAAELSRSVSPGDRALLLYPPGVEFFEAFLGCLFAGVVAVPMFPPTPSRLREAAPRLIEMLRNASPRVVLTPSSVRSHAELLTMHYEDAELLKWVHNDTIDPRGHLRYRRPDIDESTIAFLQYTSGSTGTPKGAIVSQGNLAANSTMILQGFDLDEPDVVCHWLPAYHDMGLIGCSLAPLSSGCHVVYMSPWDFLTRPIRWLRAITHYRATANAAPNFAFELCNRRVTDKDKEALDLSSWKAAMNGSEPINAGTLARFADKFSSCGFRVSAYRPCYGLAEATLVVSGNALGPEPVKITVDPNELARNVIVEVPAAQPNAIPLVASGRIMKGVKIAIVDPNTGERVPDGQVGEIWTHSAAVALGYWRNDEATEETFRAKLKGGPEHYLRTGDLGFVRDDALFVTGRIKDLIIWHGVNYYPHDIEATVEEVPGVRTGRTAAFAIAGESEERLVVIVEYDRRHRSEGVASSRVPTTTSEQPQERRWNNELPTGIHMVPSGSAPDTVLEEPPAPMKVLIAQIRERVTAKSGLPVFDVVLTQPGAIPRTSSGKTRRGATRDLYVKRELPVLESFQSVAPSTAASTG